MKLFQGVRFPSSERRVSRVSVARERSRYKRRGKKSNKGTHIVLKRAGYASVQMLERCVPSCVLGKPIEGLADAEDMTADPQGRIISVGLVLEEEKRQDGRRTYQQRACLFQAGKT